jgi:hypothetical protein
MGRRQCELEGCSKQAMSGGTPDCIAHGGDKRCQHAGCSKSAMGDTGHCVTHGGGRRCQHVGCTKAAKAGGTPHCTAHGGGRRCQHAGCTKSVLEIPAARSARYVCGAHSLSPTVRRRCNPQHTTPRHVGPVSSTGDETRVLYMHR